MSHAELASCWDLVSFRVIQFVEIFFVGARSSILIHIHLSGRPMRLFLHAHLCGTAEIEPVITFLYNFACSSSTGLTNLHP